MDESGGVPVPYQPASAPRVAPQGAPQVPAWAPRPYEPVPPQVVRGPAPGPAPVPMVMQSQVPTSVPVPVPGPYNNPPVGNPWMAYPRESPPAPVHIQPPMPAPQQEDEFFWGAPTDQPEVPIIPTPSAAAPAKPKEQPAEVKKDPQKSPWNLPTPKVPTLSEIQQQELEAQRLREAQLKKEQEEEKAQQHKQKSKNIDQGPPLRTSQEHERNVQKPVAAERKQEKPQAPAQQQQKTTAWQAAPTAAQPISLKEIQELELQQKKEQMEANAANRAPKATPEPVKKPVFGSAWGTSPVLDKKSSNQGPAAPVQSFRYVDFGSDLDFSPDEFPSLAPSKPAPAPQANKQQGTTGTTQRQEEFIPWCQKQLKNLKVPNGL